MSQVYEGYVGKTRYTAEHDTKSRMPPFVKLTRYNRDGKTEMFFPTRLLWQLVTDQIHERVSGLVTRLLTEWRP